MLINRSFKVVESDVFVGSVLIDMCAKCGSMGDALRVFNKMTPCDVVSWNAMVAR
jgi:pentatricopeptide repeat protein